jgi:uncharacterized damage-inducible protein DinB
MPGNVRPVTDEQDALLAYLGQQRDVLVIAAHGLTEDEARATPARSGLSVGGLVKHVDAVEREWMAIVQGRPTPFDPSVDWQGRFRLGPDETLAGTIAAYRRTGAATDHLVTELDDLGRPVPVPRDTPWFPADVEAWSLRWVLLHLIQETARHAGHADLVREAVDGATAFPLMAAVEGRPASPWVTPWARDPGRA